jgi:hypothetical protein
MRRLYLVWGFLDLCLLAAGVLSVAISIVFMSSKEHLILQLIFDRIDFKSELTNRSRTGLDNVCLRPVGVVLGAMYILAVLLSVPAILQPKDRPILLKVLNWFLMVTAIITLAVRNFAACPLQDTDPSLGPLSGSSRFASLTRSVRYGLPSRLQCSRRYKTR